MKCFEYVIFTNLKDHGVDTIFSYTVVALKIPDLSGSLLINVFNIT